MKLSQIIDKYKLSGDKISGGKGDKSNIDNVNKKELAVGILIEKEHTNNILEAVAIALDHLTEKEDYYSKLIASGIVDEKPALELAKNFGWFINESLVINHTTVHRILEINKRQNIQETDQVIDAKINSGNILKRSSKKLLSGIKKEGANYKKAVIAIRELIAGNQLTPENKKALIAILTDILWKAGIIAIFASFGAAGTALPKAVLLSFLKKGVINALTDGVDNISDDELMDRFIKSIGDAIQSINITQLKELNDIESMSDYTIPVEKRKLNDSKTNLTKVNKGNRNMNYGELKNIIIKEYHKIMKENDEIEDGRTKSIGAILGPKQERGIIEGLAVKDNYAAILKIVTKHDKNHKMQFYPATGKIVGAVASTKLPHIKKDLASIDKDIKIYLKPQSIK